MTIEQQIEFFFTPPNVPSSDKLLSTLFLARKEAQDCLIGDVVREDLVLQIAARRGPHRLFATVMVIASGIDLLGKMYDGHDNRQETGKRIKAFTKRYMFAGARNPARLAEVFYLGCRNPVMHSFSMKSDRFTMGLVSGEPLGKGALWSVRGRRDAYVLSVEGLYLAFIQAIEAYRAELVKRDDLKTKFRMMFAVYGAIPFGVKWVQPYKESA